VRDRRLINNWLEINGTSWCMILLFMPTRVYYVKYLHRLKRECGKEPGSCPMILGFTVIVPMAILCL
jgi:hypothetical protein